MFFCSLSEIQDAASAHSLFSFMLEPSFMRPGSIEQLVEFLVSWVGKVRRPKQGHISCQSNSFLTVVTEIWKMLY